MKKISQIAIICIILLSAVVQASATEIDENELDSSFKEVDFETKEIVIYPHSGFIP